MTQNRAELARAAEVLGIARAAIEQRLDDGSALALLREDYREKERLKLQRSPRTRGGGLGLLSGAADTRRRSAAQRDLTGALTLLCRDGLKDRQRDVYVVHRGSEGGP